MQRVLSAACVMRPDPPLRPGRGDPYLPFIRDTLAKFPTLTASRLHAMVRERGYAGGPDHFRHLVACHCTASQAASIRITAATRASTPRTRRRLTSAR